MNEETPPPPSAAIGWLRIVVWLMPFSILLTLSSVPPRWAYLVPPTAMAIIYFGSFFPFAYLDARLHCHQLGLAAGNRKTKFFMAAAFVTFQFLSAPILMLLHAQLSL